MKKMLFIINAVSGRLALEDTLMRVVEIFAKSGYDVNIHLTKGENDVELLIKDHGHEYDLVVCCGGDGTLNEVVTHVYNFGIETKIGYIPGGTTNDFACTHKIDTVTTGAATQIAEGLVREVDIGLLNGKPFVYVAAFGLFSDVSYMTDRSLKQNMGHAAYVIEGIKSVIKAKSYKLKIEYDDNVIDGDFILGMISNSKRIGGFELPILKNILYDDGEMEVTLVRKPKNAGETQKILNKVIAPSNESDMIYAFKASKLRITSDQEIPWSIDGEYGGSFSEMDIIVDCGAVDMVF
ncbi:MAG: diacylglycerol kinase family lipid kinase [Ruminococcaceae bacterium]|nr:diacylglycerol kinase family lipid kinase [Oscillospiraceae bacterium]